MIFGSDKKINERAIRWRWKGRSGCIPKNRIQIIQRISITSAQPWALCVSAHKLINHLDQGRLLRSRDGCTFEANWFLGGLLVAHGSYVNQDCEYTWRNSIKSLLIFKVKTQSLWSYFLYRTNVFVYLSNQNMHSVGHVSLVLYHIALEINIFVYNSSNRVHSVRLSFIPRSQKSTPW